MAPIRLVGGSVRHLLSGKSMLAAKLVLSSSVVVRITAAIIFHDMWAHWSTVDYLSIALIVVATFMMWSAFVAIVRNAETNQKIRDAQQESIWRARHAALLAREQEILTKMEAACIAAGITPSPKLHVVSDSSQETG